MSYNINGVGIGVMALFIVSGSPVRFMSPGLC